MANRDKSDNAYQALAGNKRARKPLTVKPRVVERALDLTEAEKNQVAFEATERFLRSGCEIKDVYGKVDE